MTKKLQNTATGLGMGKESFKEFRLNNNYPVPIVSLIHRFIGLFGMEMFLRDHNLCHRQ